MPTADDEPPDPNRALREELAAQTTQALEARLEALGRERDAIKAELAGR